MSQILAALVLAPLTLSAHAGPKGKPAFYHPTRVGDALVYAVQDDDKNTEWTYTVEKAEAKDGAVAVVMKCKPTGLTRRVKVSDKVVLLVSEGVEFDPPVTLLKLPARAGDTWDSTPKDAKLGTEAGHTCKVLGEEVVEVPAGKFKAIRVDSVVSLSGEQYTVSQWYAPGVGLVKKVAGGGDRTQVLKSFTPGK